MGEDWQFYAVGISFPILVTWGVYVANQSFPEFNRPQIFRGTAGTAFFNFLNLLLMGGAISGLVWVFSTFSWWIGILLIVIGVAFVDRTASIWQPTLLGSALGQMIASFGLIAIHWLAWN
jgi:hypothetical protein